MIRLEKVNAKNVWDILKLHVAKDQEDLVTPNDLSIIEAYIAVSGNGHAFPFGIYEDEIPVGFLMIGYEKCTCPKVLSGQITDPDHCNCTRQSILYILSQQEPDSRFEVEIPETVLRGAEHCRFRITKNKLEQQIQA